MKKGLCVYPGSFDPVTIGHLDLIERGADIFPEVVVAVLHNPAKEGCFPIAQRLELLSRACAHLPNVRFDQFDGLLVDYMRKLDAGIVLRGLRAVTDFESEFQMAQLNHQMAPDVETLFMMTTPISVPALCGKSACLGGILPRLCRRPSWRMYGAPYNVDHILTGGKRTMQQDAISAFRKNLNDLEEIVMQAKRVPLSNMCMVDRERILGLANAITTDLPTVFAECEGVVQNQITIISEANERAEQTKQNATMRANQYVTDAKNQAQQMTAQAQQQAQEMLKKAQQQAAGMVREAQEQASNMVKDAENRARQLVSEQEITARANMEAEELRQNTHEEIEKLYNDVYRHIDEVLAQLDRSISEKLTDIRMTRQQIDQSMSMR